MSETLVEALEKAGLRILGPAVAAAGPTLLPILARFASPEVKREVLRTLLEERCAELTPDDWRQLADSAGAKSYWSIYNDRFDVSETVVGVFAPEVPRG